MKNKYNFSQVAQIYCDELGIYDVPTMELYLKGVFSDLPTQTYEKNIIGTIIKNENGKLGRSEYFPDFYLNPQAELLEGTAK